MRRVKRHLAGTVSMVVGSAGVFATLLVMNAFQEPPKEPEKDKNAEFKVEKKPPPKKKKKQRRKVKPQRRMSSAAPPPMPNLGAAISGVSFSLPQFENMDLSQVSTDVLGDTSKKLVMTEDAVDQLPSARSQPTVKYPPGARKRGVEGFVQLNMLIDADGRVEQIRILQSKPSGVFEEAAREWAQGSTYSPALYQGEPVPLWVKQKVRFELGKS